MDTNLFTQPKKKQNSVNSGILESLRNIPAGVGKTLTKDLPAEMGQDILSAMFGPSKPVSGEIKQNQSLEFGNERNQPTLRPTPELRTHRVSQFVESGLKDKIEAVRIELKALASSIRQLNTEVEKAVNEVPVNPGIYHENFFDRLRSMLQLLREQVDDSRTWLSMQTKKKSKMKYWGMYKKHGTTFGLSNERTLATQAG